MTFVRLLGELVPTGSFLRTSEDYCLQTTDRLWPESLQDWPQTGSLRNGLVYERPTLERPTDDCGGSALPTPLARDWKDGVPCNNVKHDALGRAVWDLPLANLLPTPASYDKNDAWKTDKWKGDNLASKVKELPTPDGGDSTPTSLPGGNE